MPAPRSSLVPVGIEGPTHATLLAFVTRPYDDAERAAHIARCWPGVNPDRIKGFLDEACTGTPETIAKELNFYIERGASRRAMSMKSGITGADGNWRIAAVSVKLHLKTDRQRLR